MSSFRADDSEFYDFEYFLSLEYRYFSRAHRSRVRNLLEFMGDVKGKKILDMGGGGGFIAYMLSDRGAHVCLADFSEAAVDLPPRTSPPSMLDSGPFEVHSKGLDPVPAT